MTRTAFFCRPAPVALCLVALAATTGCAHFREAEERAHVQADVQRPSPPLARAEAPPPQAPVQAPTPVPPPAAAPAPEVAAEPAPAPAFPPPTTAVPTAPTPPLADNSARESVPEAPATPAPPTNTVVAAPPVASAAPAPATDDAVIVFANNPGTGCGTCDTLKISVAPSGQVLMERGSWASADHGNWRYKRSRADVGPARAAEFAASLSAYRPTGNQLLASGTACPGPASEADGLTIEWIEADRDDQLTFDFSCAAGRNSQMAETLRRAPDLLGLGKLAFPWDLGR